jgi:hypothetical protein
MLYFGVLEVLSDGGFGRFGTAGRASAAQCWKAIGRVEARRSWERCGQGFWRFWLGVLGDFLGWPAERLRRRGGRVERERVNSSCISRAALEERIRREGFTAIGSASLGVLIGWQGEKRSIDASKTSKMFRVRVMTSMAGSQLRIGATFRGSR